MKARTATILSFIADFIDREGYSPSLRDVVAGTTIPLTTVGYHLDKLQGHGLITRRPGCVRTIRLTGEAP